MLKSVQRRGPVGNRAGNAQIDLGACAGCCPDLQLTADVPGALAHSGQAVVAGAALSRDFRINAASVITDTQAQQLFAIRDFRFYMARLRVVESVAHGLTGDAVDFVAEDRMQVP